MGLQPQEARVKIGQCLGLALAATLLAGLPAQPPAFAQRNPGVVDIFGNDKCPTDAQGNEIVVCRRLPESERARIPLDLRKSEARDNQSSGERAALIESTGRSGAQSCSASGSAGGSGCFREMARKACEEDKAQGKKCGIGF
jgi:hypothetical protein